MMRRRKIYWRVSWRDESQVEHWRRYQVHDFATKAEAESFAQTLSIEPRPEPVEIQVGYLSS